MGGFMESFFYVTNGAISEAGRQNVPNFLKKGLVIKSF